MKRALLWIALLSGCNMPSPGFYGTEAHTVSEQGARFVIRFNAQLAEVTRTNPEILPRFGQVAGKAGDAVIKLRPSCKPIWVRGDPSMMVFGLVCDGQNAPRKPHDAFDMDCKDPLGQQTAATPLCSVF